MYLRSDKVFWKGYLRCAPLLSKNTCAISVESCGIWIVYLFLPHEQPPLRGRSRFMLRIPNELLERFRIRGKGN
jgi:hypothetical protein